MPCGTCGCSGHNTTSCTVRKLATAGAEYLGGAVGGAVGGAGDTACGGTTGGALAYVGEQAGERGGKYVADSALQTKGQKQYAARK